jgi:YVTN family beta-propeller protein
MYVKLGPNMKRTSLEATLLASTFLSLSVSGWAGQAPGKASDADVPLSHHDRVYVAEQFSNTVFVVDPVDNKLLGVIRLGDPQPANLSPLYRPWGWTEIRPLV